MKPPTPKPKVESRAWLYDRAVRQRLSVPRIAVLAGCGVWKVVNRMKRFGIPRNPVGYNLSRNGADNFMAQPGAVNPFTGRTHKVESLSKIGAAASRPRPGLRGPANGMYGRRGKTNPNWRGGVSPDRALIYDSDEWRSVAAYVRRRDGYQCRRCSVPKGSSGSLHLHHILPWADYPSYRLNSRNIVTLCKTCHDWVHSNENSNREWVGEDAFTSFETVLANQ